MMQAYIQLLQEPKKVRDVATLLAEMQQTLDELFAQYVGYDPNGESCEVVLVPKLRGIFVIPPSDAED